MSNSKLLTPDFAKRVVGFTVHAMDSQTGKQKECKIRKDMVFDYIQMANEESAKRRTFLVTLASNFGNKVMVLTGDEWARQQAFWNPQHVVVKALECDVKEMKVGRNIYKLTFYSVYSVEDERVQDPATKLLAYLVAGVVFPFNTGVLMYAKFDFLRRA